MPKLMLANVMKGITLGILIAAPRFVWSERLLQESQPAPCAQPKVYIPVRVKPNQPSPATNPERQTLPPCQPKETSPQTTGPPRRIPGFKADERVVLVVPDHKLILTEANEVSLLILSQGLLEVGIVQSRYSSSGNGLENIEGSAVEHAPILHHPDGSSYVNVIPVSLGTVKLSINGRFSDNGFFSKNIDVEVGLPARQPTHVGVPDFIDLTLANHERSFLEIKASYDGIDVPLSIDPSYARLIVRTSGSSPVITFDESKGQVTPVHSGHALIETWFGGKKNLTCVVVRNTPLEFQPLCKDLLASGESLH